MPSYSGVWGLPAQMQARAAGNWTIPPDAPTIGTATAGDAEATVTFTPPVYTGNPAGVTGYTVTSSPGGITASGASSPITVTGLTNGVSYTFTVTATGTASGTSVPSAASNSVTPVPSILLNYLVVAGGGGGGGSSDFGGGGGGGAGGYLAATSYSALIGATLTVTVGAGGAGGPRGGDGTSGDGSVFAIISTTGGGGGGRSG